MASLGDSITRAFDVRCFYGDHPSNSWATGNSGLDGIQSHYERLLACPAISGHQALHRFGGHHDPGGDFQQQFETTWNAS
jgi:hypothetical protein